MLVAAVYNCRQITAQDKKAAFVMCPFGFATKTSQNITSVSLLQIHCWGYKVGELLLKDLFH